MIEWDKVEFFRSGVAPLIKYAVSERHGVRVELSMHDETIRKMVPERLRFEAMSFPTNNAKIERIEGALVVLIKAGPDAAGCFVLVKVKTQIGFSPDRLACAITFILASLKGAGIEPGKEVERTIRGN